jgi:hypothetical protein
MTKKVEVEQKKGLRETTETPLAYNTMLLVFEDSEKKAYSFTIQLINFGTEENSETINVIFDYDLSAIKSKIEDIKPPLKMVADYTDDPTPIGAGLVVSLGYPLVRIEFKKCTITNFDPLVVSGKPEDLDVKFNREQRDSLIDLPNWKRVKVNDRMFEVTKNSVLRRYYSFFPAFDEPLYLISCLTGRKNFTSVDMIDMTTFYHSPELIEYNKHRKKDKAIEKYLELIKKWRKVPR